jgi:hypothetical protein
MFYLFAAIGKANGVPKKLPLFKRLIINEL